MTMTPTEDGVRQMDGWIFTLDTRGVPSLRIIFIEASLTEDEDAAVVLQCCSVPAHYRIMCAEISGDSYEGA